MNPKLLLFIKKTNFSSRTIDDLVVEAKSLKIKHKIFNTVFDSIEFISSTNNSINYNKFCLITGSINFVGEVLSKDKKIRYNFLSKLLIHFYFATLPV